MMIFCICQFLWCTFDFFLFYYRMDYMITSEDIDLMKNIFVTKEDLRSELAKYATKKYLEQMEVRMEARLEKKLNIKFEDNNKKLMKAVDEKLETHHKNLMEQLEANHKSFMKGIYECMFFNYKTSGTSSSIGLLNEKKSAATDKLYRESYPNSAARSGSI